MQTIEIGSITIADTRQRQLFKPDALDKLADSIAKHGLFHPIVLREYDYGYHLVAGERRLRAVQKLHNTGKLFSHNDEVVQPHHIPYILVSAMTDHQRREIELEENIIREDLTWQEREAALASLHELRVEQNPKQTTADTARELASTDTMAESTARAQLARAAIVKEHLDDPDVRTARNANEAFNIVAKKREAEFAAMLKPAKRVGNYEVKFGRLEEHMRVLGTRRFKVIIADPPYGMGADTFGDAAKLSHKYTDTQDAADRAAWDILRLGFSNATDDAHLFMFCDIENFTFIRDSAEGAGWCPWRTPLIWYKGTKGHAPDPDHGPRRSYECIMFCAKRGAKIRVLQNDLIEVTSDLEKYHAAQKPAALYKHLLQWSAIPGDEVLDPCCGRGTIFLAAHELNLKAYGIEADSDAHLQSIRTIRGLA